MKAITNHWREPLPYLRGRENQTASWVILVGLEGAGGMHYGYARGKDEVFGAGSDVLTEAGVAVRLADDGDDESPLSCIVPPEIRFVLTCGGLRHVGNGRLSWLERY